jgi:hypothetical protein
MYYCKLRIMQMTAPTPATTLRRHDVNNCVMAFCDLTGTFFEYIYIYIYIYIYTCNLRHFLDSIVFTILGPESIQNCQKSVGQHGMGWGRWVLDSAVFVRVAGITTPSS